MLALLLWLAFSRPTVTVAPVVRGRVVAAVYAPGTVRSATQTVVAAAASGRVTNLLVARGASVVPGQVVAQLDETPARLQLTQAQSALATARANVPPAEARVQTARENVTVQRQARLAALERVGAARAAVRTAEAQLADARDALARQQFLYARGAVAQRQVVQARTAERAAAAVVAERQANQRAAEQGVIQAEAAIAAAQAQVVEAQRAAEAVGTQVATASAAVAQAQNALSNYTVRSLVSGTVSDVPVHVGDFVPQGSPVATVVSTRDLYVQADVDEADIGPIRVGQVAYFTTDAVPNRTFRGAVSQVGASAQGATNTYPVDIKRLADTSGLRVNMSVDVNIITRQNPRALLVPSTAVVTDPAPHVWMVDADARLRQRAVRLGARDISGGRIEILEGLQEGDEVVRFPQPAFRDGQRVRVAATTPG